MERLVSKELDNDRGSEKIHHVSKEAELVINAKKNTEPVSYTHLDVYKRQL